MAELQTNHRVRALHWVLKVGSLKSTLEFLCGQLGMHVIRHEEFSDGCDAQCNGVYNGAWSKTMVGYGPESSNFVLELTYNYGVDRYEKGNDLLSIGIRAVAGSISAGPSHVESPDGYTFVVERVESGEPVSALSGVTLNVSDLDRSIEYWSDTLGMNIESRNEQSAVLSYDGEASSVTLTEDPTSSRSIDHKQAYGRIAFSTSESIQALTERVTAKGFRIHTEPVTLSTPGKADVHVVILADPDDYEICYVHEDGFNDLSAAEESSAAIDWDLRREGGGR